MGHLTSVIIPTIGRPDRSQPARSITGALETAGKNDVEVIAVVDGVNAALGALKEFLPNDKRIALIWKGHAGPIAAWNYGAMIAHGDMLVLGSDDVVWHAGWLDEVLAMFEKLPDECGEIGMNDTHRGAGDFATHFALTRSFCMAELGGVFIPPCYKNYYIDVEIWARAMQAGRYVWAERAIVEHRHPLYGGPMDDVYKAGMENYAADLALFNQRMAAGFSNDWKAML